MKPLKLIMTAFGPYASVQEIDFTQLKGRNIFLITGPTGAGKTTIFDGICFALYGRASGKDREGDSLRSHFADDELLTSVELEFELKGSKYYIKREPKQLKKKVRGEGFIDHNATAELKFLDKTEKGIYGVREVNEKIVDIIGLTYEQFRQIIMIPQGEFRELLLADSKDRENILQKIFGTQELRDFQDRLGDLAKTFADEIQALVYKRDENIIKLDTSSNDELNNLVSQEYLNVNEIVDKAKDLIALDNEQLIMLKEKMTQLEECAEHKLGEIRQAEEANRLILYRQEIEKQKNILEKNKPEYELKKEKLKAARKAFSLINIEKNCCDRKIEAQELKIKLTELNNELKINQAEYQAALKEIEKQHLNSEERLWLQESLTVLKGLATKIQELDERQRRFDYLNNALKKNEGIINSQNNVINKLNEEIKTLRTKLDMSKQAEVQWAVKEAELFKINDVYNKLIKLENEEKNLSNSRKNYVMIKNEFITQEQLVMQLEEKLHCMRENFIKGQAGALALTLNEGSPCPVCGATVHPHPAKIKNNFPAENELQLIESQLKTAKEDLNKVREKFENIKIEGMRKKESINELVSVLTELTGQEVLDVQTMIFKYSEAIDAAKENLKQLETEKNQHNLLSAQLLKNEKTLEKAEIQLKVLKDEYISLYAKHSSEQSLINSIKKDLPEDITSLNSLEINIKQQQTRLDALNKALEEAIEKSKQAEIACEKKKAEVSALTVSVATAENIAAQVENDFNMEIQRQGFCSVEQYHQSKMTEHEMEVLDEDIISYQEKMCSVTDAYIKILKDTKKMVVQDIDKLKLEYEEIKEMKEQYKNKHVEVAARLYRNKVLLDSIMELNAKINEKEEQYTFVSHLANIARGFNAKKITFERFVLASFFEDIIKAANWHFARMTNNRYEMSRIPDRVKGNSQSGLEIEIFDYYTGRNRHVKTLSGGESFKASLALALGLADVVQSYAGGVSLETMFVDEGFGSLDPESLDSAIKCLIDLEESGRLVGIISHVPELKQSIDAKLEVVAGYNGSQAFLNVF